MGIITVNNKSITLADSGIYLLFKPNSAYTTGGDFEIAVFFSQDGNPNNYSIQLLTNNSSDTNSFLVTQMSYSNRVLTYNIPANWHSIWVYQF